MVANMKTWLRNIPSEWELKIEDYENTMVNFQDDIDEKPVVSLEEEEADPLGDVDHVNNSDIDIDPVKEECLQVPVQFEMEGSGMIQEVAHKPVAFSEAWKKLSPAVINNPLHDVKIKAYTGARKRKARDPITTKVQKTPRAIAPVPPMPPQTSSPSPQLKFKIVSAASSHSLDSDKSKNPILESRHSQVPDSSIIISDTTHNLVSVTGISARSAGSHKLVSNSSQNSISDLEHNLVSNSSNNLIADTRHNLVSNTSQNVCSSPRHNLVSNTSNNSISASRQSLVSNTSQSLFSGPRHNLVSNTSTNSISASRYSLVTNTSQNVFSRSRHNLVSNTSTNSISASRRNLVSNTNQNVFLGPRHNIVSNTKNIIILGSRSGLVPKKTRRYICKICGKNKDTSTGHKYLGMGKSVCPEALNSLKKKCEEGI